MYRAIEALLVIHNICIDLKDVADDIQGVNIADNLVGRVDQRALPHQNPEVVRALGLARRKQLVEYWARH
jgi:hypothetical protein